MKIVKEPEVYIVGMTMLDHEGLRAYLESIGITEEDWFPDPRVSDAENLIEAGGRMCYRSWAPWDPEKPLGTNPNVTKVREGNNKYMANVIRSRHGCYDSETEVLTAQGWRYWADVTKEDALATRTAAGCLEYHRPTRLVHYVHTGRMYRVEARGVDLFVTPDHSMLVCPTTTCAGRRKEDYRLIPAKELGTKSHAYITCATWPGGSSSPLTPELAAILGFTIGDGTVCSSGRVSFNIRKERKIAWLSAAAKRAGLELRGPDTSGKFTLRAPEDVKGLFLATYDDARDRCIPQELFAQAPRAVLSALYEGLITADGSDGPSGISFTTASKHLAGQFQQLCLHVGLAAREVALQEDRTGAYGERPVHRLHVTRRELRPEVNKYAGSAGKSYWVDAWEGEVYCAEVPNHTLYVRRNGIPVWSGNSLLEHATVSFVFKDISRVLSHELTRHRAGWAYCLSGDTEVWSGAQENGGWNRVKRKWTLRELYEKNLTSHGRSRLKLCTVRTFDGDLIVPAKIKAVMQSGEKDVVRVTLANGRQITCSKDHRFLTQTGWLPVHRLTTGVVLACNGQLAKDGTRRGLHMQTLEACERRRQEMQGAANPQWKGAEASAQAGRLRAPTLYPGEGQACATCGRTDRLHRRHKDHDTYNNAPENIAFLCASCHAKLHPRPPLTASWSPIVSIEPCGREMTYDLEVDHPSHNFVANGIITHNSQESLRYVRLNDLRFWIPQMVKDQEGGVELFKEVIEQLEQVQQKLFRLFGIDGIKNFATKKLLTSMFRRLAPIGLSTSIMATANLRAWRHTIALRTSTHAEEEIRLVFSKVARHLKRMYPHAFFDMSENEAGEWVFENEKI